MAAASLRRSARRVCPIWTMIAVPERKTRKCSPGKKPNSRRRAAKRAGAKISGDDGFGVPRQLR